MLVIENIFYFFELWGLICLNFLCEYFSLERWEFSSFPEMSRIIHKDYVILLYYAS